MARFLVHDGQQGLREISLKPGVNRVGRREENDHQINDPTVSSFHCEIRMTDGIVTVKDLGSTNGTFLNAARIQEATLTPGQILRLGGVELVFHDDLGALGADSSVPPLAPAIRGAGSSSEFSSPPAAALATPVAETVILQARGPNDCSNHPGTSATFLCQRCGALACPACVKTQQAANRIVYSCPSCGGLCVNAEAHRKALLRQQATFFSLLPDAFRYPLRQNGPILLVCGTIVFTLVELARLVLQNFRMSGFMGFAYWITMVMSVGYLFAFMQNIIVSSTNGEENMPGFPEVSNFSDDIFMPFVRFVMIWAVCLGPGIATTIFLSPVLGVLILLLGLFCFPMSLLTVSLADSIGGLNPLIIFSGISKVPGPYLVTCLILVGVTGLGRVSQMLLELFGIPLLPMILTMPISLYGLTVGMRILGLLYYTNKEKLSWFS